MSTKGRSLRPPSSGALAGGAPAVVAPTVSPRATPPSKAAGAFATLMAAPGRALQRALGGPSSVGTNSDESESELDSEEYAERRGFERNTVPKHPPAGLLNCGDTCYLNSVVQVLFHIPAFRKSVLSYELSPDVGGSDKDEEDSKRANAEAITLELQKLFRDMGTTNNSWLEPSELVDMLRDKQRDLEFQADGQQDAHEFLRFLLENIETALAVSGKPAPSTLNESSGSSSSGTKRTLNGSDSWKTMKRPRSSDVNGAGSSKNATSDFRLEEETIIDGSSVPPPSERVPLHGNNGSAASSAPGYGAISNSTPFSLAAPRFATITKNDEAEIENATLLSNSIEDGFDPHVVRSIFSGESVTSTRCCECETASSRPESFLDLSVPVRMGCSLSGLFMSMTAGDMLNGTNKYACEVCLTKTEAERRFFLKKIPPVFTIHLKLFQFTATRAGAKIPVATPCPFRMRFNRWCTKEYEKTTPTYELTAVIVHNGGFSTSGHYYAFIKNREWNQWYRFDDATVTEESEAQIESLLFSSAKSKKTGYLLFYSTADD